MILRDSHFNKEREREDRKYFVAQKLQEKCKVTILYQSFRFYPEVGQMSL